MRVKLSIDISGEKNPTLSSQEIQAIQLKLIASQKAITVRKELSSSGIFYKEESSSNPSVYNPSRMESLTLVFSAVPNLFQAQATVEKILTEGLTHNFLALQWCESYMRPVDLLLQILNCDPFPG